MTLNIYIAFIIAATLLIIVPGPTNMVIISHAMSFGWRRSLATIWGVSVSHTLFFSITALELATFLLASAAFFDWLKWLGAAYLIWVGFKQWRAAPETLQQAQSKSTRSTWSLFIQGFAVNTTNPKALIFYAAFFPPFLNPNNPVGPQLVIMGATFVTILIIVSVVYAFIAARTRAVFSSPRQIRTQNRITGLLLIGAGAGLAAVKSK